jgi:hypothetical protein
MMAAPRATKRKLTGLTVEEEEQPITGNGVADVVTYNDLHVVWMRLSAPAPWISR